MTRPQFREIFMKLAWNLSERSTCKRLQVGCVITTLDHTRILSIGYNGNFKGGANTCDSDEQGNCGCLHSEENAIIKCFENSSVGKIVYCTDLPCKMCAKRIVNLGGVHMVVYDREYRVRDCFKVFEKAGISIFNNKGEQVKW